MDETFRSLYSKLNKAQKKAVDNIEGPLLVIAGPGTGKTQLLSLRVANILSKTDASEDNILCLTFTESAVNEMRDRLSHIIGPVSQKININTYHGFANELIRQHPEYFNNVTSMESAGNLLIDKLLREIVSQLPISNPYKNSRNLNDIKGLISDFKKAALYPKDIEKIVRDNLDFIKLHSKVTTDLTSEIARISKKSLPAFNKLFTKNEATKSKWESLETIWNRELAIALDKGRETGDNKPLSAWKTKFLAKDQNNNYEVAGGAQNEKILSLMPIYDEYLKSTENLGRFDFDDMILKSIAALKKYPDFRYTLQEKYQYILLDEYQDTNEAQAELVSLLCDNPINEGKPNVMAVGDDDQAIYAFQGASHSHMLNFINSYKEVQLITLETNYRSSQAIIDVSSAIANQIDSRLSNQIKDINKVFTSANKSKGDIKLLKFSDQACEYSWIADNIKKTPTGYADIAILSPKHKYLKSLATYLQAKDIPINYERRENVLDDPYVNELITICKLLAAIADNNKKLTSHLLSKVLHYSFWQIDTEAIWQLSIKAYDNQSDWLNIMLKDKSLRPIALFLIKLSSNCLDQRFDVIIDQIIGLSETKIKDKSLASYTSPFYEYYKGDQILTLRTFSSLMHIRKEFRSYSEGSHGPLLLSDFIDFIDNVVDSGLTMLNKSPYIESPDSVNLMTAYKAKGMEFKTVYMLSAIDEVWGAKARGRSNTIGLPPNLTYIRRSSLDDDDEKLRLVYVSLTRAKNNLYLPMYQTTDSDKPTTDLKYLAALINIKEEVVKPGKKESATELVTYFNSDYKQLLEKSDVKATIKKRLENYKLNPSNLNTFLNVMHEGPSAFYNKVILKYPSAESPQISYGNAIHKSLEYLHRHLSANNKLPGVAQVTNEFIAQLKRQHLSTKEFDDLAEKGTLALKLFLANNKNDLKASDLSEVSFASEGILVGSAKVNGNIDKLIVDQPNKSLVIVDYKTGTPHANWSKQVTVHLYQNQLYFYKLLVNNSNRFKDYSVNSAYLQFISAFDNNKPSQLALTYSEERQKKIEQLISAVWKHINDLDFPDISKYSQDINGVLAFEEDLINGDI
jgi:DNA helicase-2/ATP-dependent DNA helicase PcrA